MSCAIHQQSSLAQLVAAIIGATSVEHEPAADTPLLPAVIGELYRFLNYAVAW